MEYKYGAKWNWTRPWDMIGLLKILDDEFPDWKPADRAEDFNGQTMDIKPGSIAFKTSEDAIQFILKYGDRFGMIIISDPDIISVQPF
jgi:hypothetical protein